MRVRVRKRPADRHYEVDGRNKDGSIDRVALSDPNTLIPSGTKYIGARFNATNDLAMRRDGNIYFCDSGPTRPPAGTRR